MVSFADRAEALPHVLVRVLDKESVLLNLETERYFGLDETGTRMWQLVTTAPSIDARMSGISFSSSEIRVLILTRFRLLWEPQRSQGIMGNSRSAAYCATSRSEQ